MTAEAGQSRDARPPDRRAEALRTYAAQAAALRQHALSTGTIRYEEVIAAAYLPGTLAADLLRRKAEWRATMGDAFVFLADYAMLDDATTVQSLVAVTDPYLQSTLVAQYESTSHAIGIAPMATDFAIFHEAGHALQRASLRTRGEASGRRSDAPEFLRNQTPRRDPAEATTVRRLQYLCSQDEFEVRLQDLNRFHALLVAGRPILNPTDSVRALTALGVPLEYAETREAFAFAGHAFSEEAFERAVAPGPVEPALLAAAFEDAHELRLLRGFALRINPSSWPHLLAKIIFEAPGHL